MVAVPFVYFGILLFYQLHKNKWHIDIACYILCIYAISAFFSILIDMFDLRSMDTRTYNITPMATFAYCGLLTMCIWPFMVYSNFKIKQIMPIRRGKVLKFLAWLFFFYFLINFALSLDNIMNVLTSDDMRQIRQDHYLGNDEETWLSKLPFVARLPFLPLNVMSECSWIFVFLAFFCVSVQKLPIVYSILFFVASLNGLIGNINTGGRSAVVFWMIGVIACYLFFLPYLEKKQKQLFKRVGIFVFILLFIYMAAMTISRFGDTDSGTQGGMIYYFGISYINFCYFFDTFDCPIPTLQIILPFTYKLMGSPIQGSGELQEILTYLTHKELGTFYTFIGQIITTSFNIVGVLYCILLSIISMIVVKKTKKGVVMSTTVFFYLLCSSVIFLGLFGHYYSSYGKTLSIIIWLFMLYFMRPQKLLKNCK